jgi:hypothetical protein
MPSNKVLTIELPEAVSPSTVMFRIGPEGSALCAEIGEGYDHLRVDQMTQLCRDVAFVLEKFKTLPTDTVLN